MGRDRRRFVVHHDKNSGLSHILDREQESQEIVQVRENEQLAEELCSLMELFSFRIDSTQNRHRLRLLYGEGTGVLGGIDPALVG